MKAFRAFFPSDYLGSFIALILDGMGGKAQQSHRYRGQAGVSSWELNNSPKGAGYYETTYVDGSRRLPEAALIITTSSA